MNPLAFQTQPLLFCQYLTMVFCNFYCMLSQYLLLKRCWHLKQHQKLSINIMINIGLWSVCGLFGFGYGVFMFWHLEQQKSSYILLFLGNFFGSTISTVSISITTLIAERIFALLLPFKYKKFYYEFIFVSFLLCLAMFLSIFVFWMWDAWPTEDLTSCNSFLCMIHLQYVSSVVRVVVGSINLVFSILFQLTLWRSNNRSLLNDRQFKRANLLVGISALTEICFNLLPQLVIIICSLVQFPLQQYIGSYGYFMTSVEAFITALVQRFLIHSTMRKSQNGKWVTKSTSKVHNQTVY